MGDNDHRGSRKALRRVPENQSFRRRIQAGRGLVQNQNTRSLQEGPRNRQPLALASRQLAGVRSKALMEAVWKCRDHICEVGPLNRFAQVVIRRRGPDKPQIRRELSFEQDGVSR